MRHVYRRPFDRRRDAGLPSLLFSTFSATVIQLAAGTVSVAGGLLSLPARFALALKRFAISLNDING